MLPNLLSKRIAHTQTGNLACGGGTGGKYPQNCETWNSGTGEWKVTHKLTGENRNHHAAWETKNGVYLVGGGGSAERTSELLKPDGTITEGFALKDKDTMAHACAIPDPENNELILTGGWGQGGKVRVYGESGWKRDMPSLNQGRFGHGCTSFIQNGKRVSNDIIGIVRSKVKIIL